MWQHLHNSSLLLSTFPSHVTLRIRYPISICLNQPLTREENTKRSTYWFHTENEGGEGPPLVSEGPPIVSKHVFREAEHVIQNLLSIRLYCGRMEGEKPLRTQCVCTLHYYAPKQRITNRNLRTSRQTGAWIFSVLLSEGVFFQDRVQERSWL